MSSDHYWIRKDEYARLRSSVQSSQARVQRAEREAAEIRRRADDRERQIRDQYQSRLDSINNSVQNLTRQHSGEIRRVSEDFAGRIARQSAEFRREAARQSDDLKGEIRSLENRVNTEINRLDTNLHEIDQRVNSIASDFNGRFAEIARQTADRRERANMHAVELENLIGAIRDLRPDKFERGRLAELETAQRAAAGNMRNEDYEAAIAMAGNAMLQAGSLLARLVIVNDLFNSRVREIRTRVSQIAERLESFSDNALRFSIGKEQYDLDYDINYWSHGAFGELTGRFQSLSEQIHNADTSDAGLDDLERFMLELDSIETGIDAADRFARDELIRSYTIEDTAVQVYNALIDQGWTQVRESSGHHDNDERMPYKTIFEDGSGNEMAIVINSGDEIDKPSFMIDAYAVNRGVSVHTAQDAMVQNITNRLRDGGFKIEDRRRRNDCDKNPTAEEFIENATREALRQNEARR